MGIIMNLLPKVNYIRFKNTEGYSVALNRLSLVVSFQKKSHNNNYILV